MKKLIVVICLLALTACRAEVRHWELIAAKSFCESHGAEVSGLIVSTDANTATKVVCSSGHTYWLTYLK